ncbi:MAG: hypothetical protein IJT21_11355 [Synergistaceae bacterium]|nr:hypothetical protein [Synergistaceae bacterium]
MLYLCTVLHFSVDGLCGAVLASYAVNEPDFDKIIYYFGLYTVIAFGLQFLAGLLLDRRKNFVLPAFVAAPVLLAGGLFTSLGIFWQVILIALGNCLFHVSAGVLILTQYKNFREPGIFVSSGALGLGLGLAEIISAPIFEAICVIFTLIALYFAKKFNFELESINESKSEKVSCSLIVGASLLLGCVILRGFGGSANIAGCIMLMPCVFALGKSAGGVLCDFIGWRKSILAIFFMSFAALQLSGNYKIILLVFAFNMTMPLTLRLLHKYFPSYPGLTFGLAAGCLVPGYFLSEYFAVSPYIMAVIQFLSLFIAGLIYESQSS